MKLSDNSYKGISDYIGKKLSDSFGVSEIETLRNILFFEVLNVSKETRFLNPGTPVTEGDLLKVIRSVNRLLEQEPIDYIVGCSEFYGRKFKVNPSVLIPRPETEELCEWIINGSDSFKELSIIDIGTGSGCIPVTLALELPNSTVMACDISEEALQVATQNAQHNNAQISFSNCDILTDFPTSQQLDTIVSNPPYVLQSDKQEMEKNVLDFEPHVALFVEDTDPLLFYRKIAELGLVYLKTNGRLYFEVHERYAKEVAELLSVIGYRDIRIRKDAQGKERMVKGSLN